MRRLASTSDTTANAASTAVWATNEAVHTPLFAARTRATPWYSGYACTSQLHPP